MTPVVTRPRSLWLNRDYMLLWSGQLVSTIGTNISGIAFPLLVLFITKSPLLLGIAGAVRAIPYILFSLPAGALIDRWNRKLTMMICDTGRALALGSIPVALYFNALTTAQIFIIAFVEGTLFVLFNIAEVACLPRVVPTEQLPQATGQNQATEATSALIGPGLGGAIYGVNLMLPFVLDAVSYAASVLSLFLIKTPFQAERAHTGDRHIGREIAEGIRWLWRQPLIRYMAFLTGGLNLVNAGSAVILIVLAQQKFQATDFQIGLIFSIGAVGGIIGAVIGAFIQKRFSFAQVIITCVWISAIVWPLNAIAPTFWVLGIIAAAEFITAPIYNVVQFSYRLSLIPDELQGRVNSVFRLLAFGFQPIGLAIAGYLVERFGPVTAILALGVVMLFLAVMTSLNTLVRTARPMTQAQPQA